MNHIISFNFARFWKVLFLLGAALCLSGFKPIGGRQVGQDLVDKSERNFQVSAHAELYRFVTVDADGDIEQGRFLIMYRYERNRVDGVFRIFPDGGNAGVTLLLNQPFGEIPDLYLKEGSAPAAFVPLEERATTLGNTDWYLEGIYDDDKNPWVYKAIAQSRVRAENCRVVESRYDDERLKAASFLSYRRTYFSVKNGRAMRSDAYGQVGNLIYRLDALMHETLNVGGEDQIRAKRIQLTNYMKQSTTILHRTHAAWEIDLSNDWFDSEKLVEWDKAADQELLALLR